MKLFKKSSKLNNVLYDVRGPVMDEANKMEESGIHILKLNIGNPAPFGFRTPDEVVQDMSAQLKDTEGYSNSKGLFSARKAIMQYCQLKNIPNLDIDDIYTGNGVSELIQMSLHALLDDNDEVLIPSPDYPLWTACVNLAGGKAVHYICDEKQDWNPDISDIESKVTDKTKAIVIINPNNPTGALYPDELLKSVVEIARRHNLMIFADEIYDRLVMDGLTHTSIASLAPDLFCVTFSGLSKSHMIAGYRIGWMVFSGNKRIARDYITGVNMLSNMRLCSNVPAQSIVQTALGGHQSVNDYIVPGGRIYEQRDYIYNALKDIPGISVVKPKAAFYIFPKMDVKKFNIVNDEQFALDLLHDKKILITRGGGFNWSNPDHFRIVYLPRIEVLEEAVEKISHFFSYYRQ
ncbi:MAG: aminotransferase class I/II-fold pyridoxal phosphate-dependent enzyme [Lagierella massiliensis]|nr:aminotransferase class I/II-fold pyridoxal phosphate-dependent enzyme [Lagierella massiliensis]